MNFNENTSNELIEYGWRGKSIVLWDRGAARLLVEAADPLATAVLEASCAGPDALSAVVSDEDPAAVKAALGEVVAATRAFDADDAVGAMVLTGSENLRDVLAFPKTQRGQDLLMESPSAVARDQLDELSLRVVARKPS